MSRQYAERWSTSTTTRRPKANPSSVTSYAAPPGFSRPTVSSNNRRSPPRTIPQPNAEPIDTPQPQPQPQPTPARLATQGTSLLHSTATGSVVAVHEGDDARLDQDLVLAPYWHALRVYGFETAAVLRSLSLDQASEALVLCGVEKVGHRWYILNRYGPHGQVHTHSKHDSTTVTVDVASTVSTAFPAPSPVTPIVSVEQNITTAPTPAVEAEEKEIDTSSKQDTSHHHRAVLYRRLHRPKLTVRRRSSTSPGRSRDRSGELSRDVHPPSEDEGDFRSSPRPSTTRTPRHHDTYEQAAPSTYHPSHATREHWWGGTSPHVASLHDSATYKTLVGLLQLPTDQQRNSDPSPKRHTRRRSTSQEGTLNTDLADSERIVEAARRRFLAPSHTPYIAPPAAAVRKPLSPFFP